MRFAEVTGSVRARWVLDRWDTCLEEFRRVVPHPGLEEVGEHDQESSGLKLAAIQAVMAERRARSSSSKRSRVDE